MKLELKEIVLEEPKKAFENFKSFHDILNCFERENNFFHSLEKELTASQTMQILFTFSFLLFLHFSFTWTSLVIKISISYLFQKFIQKSKLEFSFSNFIYGALSFTSSKNKSKYEKFKIYQQEKKEFLLNFFSFPVNKEIIFQYLHNFYKDNEYRLSSEVFSEIDSIKSSIEKESYEIAFEQILKFKSRIKYIEELKN